MGHPQYMGQISVIPMYWGAWSACVHIGALLFLSCMLLVMHTWLYVLLYWLQWTCLMEKWCIHYAALAVARIFFFTVLACPCCSWHIIKLHDLLFSKASWLMTD